jgi:hypothetical protein
VPDQHARNVAIGGGAKPIEVKRRGDAWYQHHRAVQRGGVPEANEPKMLSRPISAI